MLRSRSALVVGLIAAFVSMVALTGCKKAGEQMIESASGGKARIEGNKLTVKTESGTMQIGGTQEWPKSMPVDVPRFAYGRIVSAVENDGPKGPASSSAYMRHQGPTSRSTKRNLRERLEDGCDSTSEDGLFFNDTEGQERGDGGFGGKGEKGFSGGVTYTAGK
jgi:hypothetical protein